ncbi:MAG TPA: alpha/beta hydrolase domain-containing protein [Acidimicrobiales bacterium]
MRLAAVGMAAGLVLAACSSDDSSGDDAGGAEDAATTTTATPVEQRGEGVAQPVVTGPVTGGQGIFLATDVIEGTGYVEDEFFFEGDATAYEADGALAADGQWTLTPGDTAPYRTRMVVRYPEDPEAFDGNVFVEWFNVTGGIDVDVAFGLGYPAIIDEGSAYVGVSVQAVGVEGGPHIEVEGIDYVPPLKEYDPERYGDLEHPGDAYAYDILSQAAQVLRRPGDVNVLGGLVPEHLIAFGESQSASRLITYVDGVHPLADIYDAFLIHGRADSAASLNDTTEPEAPTLIRGDLTDPVFQFEAETDVGRGFYAARQPDTDLLRTWETAGTAHADQSILDYTAGLAEEFDLDLSDQCPAINDGPQAEVLRAAFDALRTWVVDGEPAPIAEPIQDEDGVIARDDLGLALGGIRTPPVDAPTIVLSGDPVPGTSIVCSLFGNREEIPPAQLAELYPTHEDYVAAVTESAEAAVADGFLRQAEADAYIAEAEDAPVPS